MSEPAEPPSPHVGAVVLAAGQGTRMRSRLPKVLHPLAGVPLIAHVLTAVRAAGTGELVIVVGHGAPQVQQALGARVRYALQPEQRGTAHAVLQALPLFSSTVARLLVVYGDTPLLTSATLRALLQAPAPLALLTAVVPDPHGYGRVVRDDAGRVRAVVEERDATPEERAQHEINVGAYAFDLEWLRARLPTLTPSASGEYYLTDLIARAATDGSPIATVPLADADEGLGINDRVQLARAEQVLQRRLRERLLRAGVTMLDPDSVFLDATVEVGIDTTILPHTFLRGRTRIGAECVIGPSTQIEDSVVGDRCRVQWSMVEGATLDTDVVVGPFAHLRPGTRLARGVMIGNYAEVKNSVLHENVQQHHFSYIGDAEVGRDTNIGAGTITCNYDGVRKHRTTIGERVFLGSDTLLVAPVTLGDDSATGSGAVVTRDVADGTLVVGVPARVLRPTRKVAGAEEQR
ncbi:MAG: bifunctional UDP-N-acetylglucosamine diphosphorylase/glucosamine-1-phosphate N-acetyltransferase GlmU [Chloroflexi bacterium]|nr:bifunctional UDP-N-acetylglucosamine diphosphorylase/glucosamine-1-phosphate N-acetyltransferase GlmU [Chloroflexota bacterium]